MKKPGQSKTKELIQFLVGGDQSLEITPVQVDGHVMMGKPGPNGIGAWPTPDAIRTVARRNNAGKTEIVPYVLSSVLTLATPRLPGTNQAPPTESSICLGFSEQVSRATATDQAKATAGRLLTVNFVLIVVALAFVVVAALPSLHHLTKFLPGVD